MFIVFYTVKIVYICICMTCSTSYCLCDTVMNPWNMCICKYVRVCVCMYVSDFTMSLNNLADFESINAEQPLEELTLEVSIKICVCHVKVIIY